MLSILIPGGAGYIGSRLVNELLHSGGPSGIFSGLGSNIGDEKISITVIDNFMYQQTGLFSYAHDPRLKIVRGDFCDTRLMQAEIKKHDLIIPLAAIVGAPACNKHPALAKALNVEAPLALFKMASPSQMILMPTTNSAYGSGDSNHFCDENSKLNPISSYAEMKVIAERALMELPNAISFRLATVFGLSSRMRLDLLVNDFVYRAQTEKEIVVFEGHFKRNYIHILDVVRVFAHGLQNLSKMKGQIYNVGLSSANLSKLELCAEIKKQIPDLVYREEAIGKDPDQRNYIVSNAKIEATGFTPKMMLSDGITELIRALPLLEMQGKAMGNV